MGDEFPDWVPADTEHVSIADPWDLDYWTRHFQVNGNRLRRAIACVGTRRVDLLANLSGNGRTILQNVEPGDAGATTGARSATAPSSEANHDEYDRARR